MLDKPFGRRTLLRGAGALTAAALAPSAAGCASDDDENALTFFFSANPDEAKARMRVVDEFQRQHPDIRVRPLLSGPGVMQQLSTFCAGGKCPDVLMSWELTYAELAARGVLLDLNTPLARDKAFAAELASDGIGRLYDTFAYKRRAVRLSRAMGRELPVLQHTAVRRGGRAAPTDDMGQAVDLRPVP